MIYALDTNIISYILKRDEQIREKMRIAVKNECEFIMLPFVYYEIKCWLIERKSKKLAVDFDILRSKMPLAEFSEAVYDKAAELFAYTRSVGKTVGSDGDLFIAAHCLTGNYTLITNNTKHFENIKGLKLENWKD